MYSKVIVFICAAGIASAGQVYQQEIKTYAQALPAATSHQRISIDTSPGRLYTVNTRKYAAPVAYEAPSFVYEAAPVAYVAPSVKAQQQSSKPAVSSQSFKLRSYNPTPVVSRTYTPTVVAYSAPVVTKYSAPVSYSSPVTYSVSAPVVYAASSSGERESYAEYSSYASSKSGPAVSHVSYSGLDANYKW